MTSGCASSGGSRPRVGMAGDESKRGPGAENRSCEIGVVGEPLLYEPKVPPLGECAVSSVFERERGKVFAGVWRAWKAVSAFDSSSS